MIEETLFAERSQTVNQQSPRLSSGAAGVNGSGVGRCCAKPEPVPGAFSALPQAGPLPCQNALRKREL